MSSLFRRRLPFGSLPWTCRKTYILLGPTETLNGTQLNSTQLSSFLLFRRICKTFGMTLAWTATSIQVAFASSMQGGLMLARSGHEALRKRKIYLGGLIKENHEDTNLDEYASCAFAALGFLFQMYFRLNPPFPLNIILSPFKLAEWSLRYGMMKAS